MQEFLEWVQRMGRLGGVVCLLVAGVVGAVGALAWGGLFPEGATHWSPLGTAIAVGIFALAAVLAAFGLVTLVRGGKAPPRPGRGATAATAAALIEQIRGREPPFYVCVACHKAFSTEECFGHCLVCASEVDCLRVDDETDLATAIAALSPPPDD